MIYGKFSVYSKSENFAPMFRFTVQSSLWVPRFISLLLLTEPKMQGNYRKIWNGFNIELKTHNVWVLNAHQYNPYAVKGCVQLHRVLLFDVCSCFNFLPHILPQEMGTLAISLWNKSESHIYLEQYEAQELSHNYILQLL